MPAYSPDLLFEKLSSPTESSQAFLRHLYEVLTPAFFSPFRFFDPFLSFIVFLFFFFFLVPKTCFGSKLPGSLPFDLTFTRDILIRFQILGSEKLVRSSFAPADCFFFAPFLLIFSPLKWREFARRIHPCLVFLRYSALADPQ